MFTQNPNWVYSNLILKGWIFKKGSPTTISCCMNFHTMSELLYNADTVDFDPRLGDMPRASVVRSAQMLFVQRIYAMTGRCWHSET